MILIEIGERVQCTDERNFHFGKKGTFIGYIANGMKVKFDDGREDLFLADMLKKLPRDN